MELSISQSNDVPVTDKTIEFVKFVCEQAISKQSVKKPGNDEHIEKFDIEITVRKAKK